MQRANRATLERVTDWDAPTPCPGWSTAQIAEHLIGGDRMISAALDDPRPSAAQPIETGTDGYQRAAAALADAFSRPGAGEKVIEAPIGMMPAQQMLVLRTIEHVVHGWDVAVSQQLPTTSLDPLAEPLIPISEQLLAELADVLEKGRPFAAPQPVAADARPVERLVALLGRDPQWRAA